MKPQMNTGKRRSSENKLSAPFCVYLRLIFLVSFCTLIFTACNELEKPKPEPYFAQTAPPPKQEFRWSNGARMPKSFDPAIASAPPETDIVRAIFEGLTDTDAKTLEAIPAIAVRWSASEDFKTWTFHLRKDAKWSNGESVTAKDFVRSWQRLASLGEKVPQRKLLNNIIGMDTENVLPVFASEEIDFLAGNLLNQTPNGDAANRNAKLSPPTPRLNSNSANVSSAAAAVAPQAKSKPDVKKLETQSGEAKSDQTADKKEVKFGVEAVDNYTLKVSLVQPDKDFPALVAHPIFRPVYADGKEFETGELSANIITNGAFRVFSVGKDGVTLDRAEFYWNKPEVALERVRFVPVENAENALEAYRAGDIDAITNANFEPLATKLLTPYDDFRRTTHSALNFYEFNRSKAPFSDRRVREALTISIERERLTEDDMDGSAESALNYLPFTEPKLAQDIERAKNLLAEAGFAEGENFPVVRLLVNRNDLQRRIARSVAKMWEKNLGVKTEVIIKEGEEFETAAKNGDYDVIRRGIVLPTTNETINMMAMFAPDSETSETEAAAAAAKTAIEEKETNTADQPQPPINETTAEKQASNVVTPNLSLLKDNSAISENGNTENILKKKGEKRILTDEDALAELPAIPLYFPASYSLVKPYVHGFDTNVLDAPSLKNVRIDNNWQPVSADVKSK